MYLYFYMFIWTQCNCYFTIQLSEWGAQTDIDFGFWACSENPIINVCRIFGWEIFFDHLYPAMYFCS